MPLPVHIQALPRASVPHFILFLPKGTRKIREGVQEGQCCGGSSEPREGAAGNAEHVPQAGAGPARPGGLAGTLQKQSQEGLSMTDMLRTCTGFKKPSHSQNNEHVPHPLKLPHCPPSVPPSLQAPTGLFFPSS